MRLARTAGMVAASVVTIALAAFAWPIVEAMNAATEVVEQATFGG